MNMNRIIVFGVLIFAYTVTSSVQSAQIVGNDTSTNSFALVVSGRYNTTDAQYLGIGSDGKLCLTNQMDLKFIINFNNDKTASIRKATVTQYRYLACDKDGSIYLTSSNNTDETTWTVNANSSTGFTTYTSKAYNYDLYTQLKAGKVITFH